MNLNESLATKHKNTKGQLPYVELMDTTLRDGEQTCGVSFTTPEKLSVLKLLLDDLKVDRVEIASARVSSGEFETVKKAAKWAKEHGYLHRLEVLGFVDGEASLKWIADTGCKVVNLLCKGSLNHCEHQLGKTPHEHIQDIKRSLALARELGLKVNIYLEDWSNGMQHSPDYVFEIVDALQAQEVMRWMLPDTLGILNPTKTQHYCGAMVKRYPELHFDFHAHNDYDLAVANVFEAVKVGIKGVHVTVNGLGERAGNASLTSVVAMLEDQLGRTTNICSQNSYGVCKLVESYSGIRIANNKPVTGDFAFTQVAGIHVDGDLKKGLYCSELRPERFGRTRAYALGKTSGKSNIIKNLETLGIELDDELIKKVTQRVIEMGDRKEMVSPDELPFIISDILGNGETEAEVKILNYSLVAAMGLRPSVNIKIQVGDESYEANASGEGQYHAFTKALTQIYSKLDRELPDLIDYVVVIPPGGRTDAYVQTIITWKQDQQIFRTRAVDIDQTTAAIKATLKMLNRIELK
ncbi:alpha-isopropylmalate synthase regulatory domain-containing protein [Bacteroides propionicifaciens]|uniref:alpha-isopropylmalate synthase regulatory domain-containing protein n=1 Tax=Bacteroides propionicifaciens TaxID=392838 RepID=UPI000376DC41